MHALHETVLRVERKLDTLIRSLGEEDEAPVELDLEGRPIGGERDPTESLG